MPLKIRKTLDLMFHCDYFSVDVLSYFLSLLNFGERLETILITLSETKLVGLLFIALLPLATMKSFYCYLIKGPSS